MENRVACRRQTVEAELLTRENLRRVWATVDGLPGRQRTVFVLRFVEEMQVAEIAETTGLNINTVKSLLYRALHTVRVAMGKRGHSLGASGLGRSAIAAESIDPKQVMKRFSAELAMCGRNLS
jgi:DNA-directed RNA polymerase specialized sigma24 family protein